MGYTEKEARLINGKSYIFCRFPDLQEFQCERCQKNKKSKIVVFCETDKSQICNACFGYLSSK